MPKAGKKTKSLLEQIADITDPKPKDIDIESADVQDGAYAGHGSGSESEGSDDEEARREHYIEMNKSSLRRQQGIGNLGPKYTGSRISRKALYSSDSEEEGSDNEEDEEDKDDYSRDNSDISSENELDENDTTDDESESNDDNVNEDRNPNKLTKKTVTDDSGEDVSDSDQSSSEDEWEQDRLKPMVGADGENSDAESNRNRIRAEIQKLEEGEKALLKSLTQTAQSDVEKGKHTLHQTRLWESALDVRIRVQKLVTASNELPHHGVFEELVETCFNTSESDASDHNDNNESDSKTNQLEEARKSVDLLLNSLVDLRKALVSQNTNVDKITKKEAKAGVKRKLMEYESENLESDDDMVITWNNIEKLRMQFRPYRDESLEKWSNKVQISASVLLSKKFKAVNQGILHQIQQTLANEERLIERTQLKRTEYNVIGANGDSDKKDINKSATVAADAHLKDRDPEIFDDTDFYQQLLRELIESRMVDANDPNASLGVRWAAVKQQSRNKKRSIDTKASKGRKLRYHVMEKLQNFMPPIPTGTWHDDMINELFSSLLGQRVPKSILDEEMAETSLPKSVTQSLVDSGEVELSGDGMRLFG